MRNILSIAACALFISVSGAGAASISYVGSFSGNGCNGNTTLADGLVQGNITSSTFCSYKGSDAILKFDGYNDSATPATTTINPNYALETSAISVNFTTNFKAGTWSYNPVGTNPVGITAVYFKGGNDYYLYAFDGAYFGGSETFNWTTGNSNLSNAVFFDSNGSTVIPLPAAGWLLIAGLGGLAALCRRKRSA